MRDGLRVRKQRNAGCERECGDQSAQPRSPVPVEVLATIHPALTSQIVAHSTSLTLLRKPGAPEASTHNRHCTYDPPIIYRIEHLLPAIYTFDVDCVGFMSLHTVTKRTRTLST